MCQAKERSFKYIKRKVEVEAVLKQSAEICFIPFHARWVSLATLCNPSSVVGHRAIYTIIRYSSFFTIVSHFLIAIILVVGPRMAAETEPPVEKCTDMNSPVSIGRFDGALDDTLRRIELVYHVCITSVKKADLRF
jgi:hypothetical protein